MAKDFAAERQRLRGLCLAATELIDELQKMYPHTMPDLSATDRELGAHVGTRQLVALLVQLRAEAKDSDLYVRQGVTSEVPRPTCERTPEERAELSAAIEADMERYLHLAELRKLRKERTTPEQRARKAAQDDTRKLRALLRETVAAARWARIETALDGFNAFECRAKVAALHAKLTQRTAKVYAKAAAGCEVSADYLADDSTDALYAEVFNVPA